MMSIGWMIETEVDNNPIKKALRSIAYMRSGTDKTRVAEHKRKKSNRAVT